MQVGSFDKTIGVKEVKRSFTTGFTIVELLIVVVVIAILASITVVAYSGVQNSAHDSAVQSDLRQLAQKVELQKSETGILPRNTAAIQALNPRVSKNSYTDTMLVSGATNYNLIYCSPTGQETDFTFVAQSKSGKYFKSGTSGSGEMTSSGSSSSVTLCTEAGVPTTGSGTDSRVFLYQSGWQSWVQG